MDMNWKYLDNQFLVETEDNYKKTVKLSNYHDAVLNVAKVSQPLLVAIYNRYHPLHQTLVTEYNAWKNAGGSQEGQTLNVQQQLDLAVGKLNGWDARVQIVFAKGTPNYLSIFPNGRKPFTKGSIDNRINAFDTLALALTPHVALASVKTEVAATYVILDGARDTQEGAKGTTKTGSGLVEAARVAAMKMQYRNLGFCMDNFSEQPMYIESLFDVATLRDKQQTEFTGMLDPLENEAVFVRTLLADDELKLKSNGNAKIRFYLATTAGGTDSDFIEVNENETRIITISEFNITDYGTHRHLTAINQSNAEETQYIVEIM